MSPVPLSVQRFDPAFANRPEDRSFREAYAECERLYRETGHTQQEKLTLSLDASCGSPEWRMAQRGAMRTLDDLEEWIDAQADARSGTDAVDEMTRIVRAIREER